MKNWVPNPLYHALTIQRPSYSLIVLGPPQTLHRQRPLVLLGSHPILFLHIPSSSCYRQVYSPAGAPGFKGCGTLETFESGGKMPWQVRSNYLTNSVTEDLT